MQHQQPVLITKGLVPRQDMPKKRQLPLSHKAFDRYRPQPWRYQIAWFGTMRALVCNRPDWVVKW